MRCGLKVMVVVWWWCCGGKVERMYKGDVRLCGCC